MKPGFLWSSDKVYTSRPPANCRSARAAWDAHSKGGPIVWMRLLDGYWGAKRADGSIDEVDNCFAMNGRKADARRQQQPGGLQSLAEVMVPMSEDRARQVLREQAPMDPVLQAQFVAVEAEGRDEFWAAAKDLPGVDGGK